MIDKRWYSREDAAEYTGLSIYKIKAAIREHRLPARRDGKNYLIDRNDLDSLVESMEVV